MNSSSLNHMADTLAAGLRQTTDRPTGCLDVLPPWQSLDELMQLFRTMLFPEVYRPHCEDNASRRHDYSAQLEQGYARLCHHIEASLAVHGEGECCPTRQQVETIADNFISQLPRIQQLLYSDVNAINANDPATSSRAEVISCYPAITVMLHYRIAHALYEQKVPLLPRMITERAHSLTGIDIHPAATIGDAFGIDHGTGIVIGETTVIGSHVMIYQGVTLGARNFVHDENGKPVNQPRHPIIEDRVTIYSNTSILGRVRIGHDSIIGGNLWITNDVPPHSRVRQSKPEAI